MSNLKTLNGRKSQDISLQDAIAACQAHFNNSAIALLYSPTACQFAKLEGGSLRDFVGKEIETAPIFEARIFNETSELRWLNLSSGIGSAVLISQDNISAIFKDECNLKYFESLPQQYVLWGEGMASSPKSSEGWSRLGAARIGAMDVPIADITTNEQRVILKVIEYLREVDDHGNVAVVEERLVCLKSFTKN
ncbi:MULTISPECIES: type III-D CRISPR-associated protein Csx19 [Pseudanabaena]|uniref:Uncharacterized protein n=2 Tax=Pseudanabaena TaxID=1152 RepID=L8MUQ2_9CYAN|nr:MULTISPECIES: CRISPR-associated protein Csx19 [Pseudanabaena]ELS31692.1 hypothetical protein Pse7429DRAFT_3286 [Pseudanabaena biceps PCC 7429]MDG3496053.1 CRISPR-associated protein Csx19 [Pseudanabaena catenata USMAC16]